MAEATTIHQLVGRVTSDITSFVTGMNKVAQSAADAAKKVAKAGADIGRAVVRIGTVTALAVTGITVQFAKFETTITSVGLVTRTLATDVFPRVEEAALKMGRTTVFTATESAEAMEKLALAGLSVDEVITALPQVLELAAAGQIEIARAADIAAKTMRAFGLEAENINEINDALVASFTTANTNILELAEAMRPVAPLAAVLDVSLTDMTATLGKLADAAFTGQLGGTALRNIFARLAGAVPEVTNKLADLGVVTLDATGKMRPFFDIMEDIEAAGLEAGKVMELFGLRAGPQMLALLNVGTEELRRYADELRSLEGITHTFSEAILGTLVGRLKILRSAFQDVVLTIGKRLRPELEGGIEDLRAFIIEHKAEIVDRLSEAFVSFIDVLRQTVKWFQDNSDAVVEFVGGIVDLLRSLADFLAQHPQVLAALVALKVTGLLGINDAVASTSSAVFSLIGLFFDIVVAASAFTVALGALSTAATAANVTLGTLFFTTLAGGLTALKTFGIAGLAALAPLFSPVGLLIVGVAAAVTALVLYRKEIVKFIAELRAFQAVAAIGLNVAGENAREKRLDREIVRRRTIIQLLVNQAAREKELVALAGGAAAGAAAAAAAGAAGAGVDIEVGVGAAGGGAVPDRSDAQERLRQSQTDQRDRQQQGFANIRDFFDAGGITAQLVEQFAVTLEDVTPQMASVLAEQFAALGPEATREQLDALALKFIRLRNEAQGVADALEAAEPALRDITESLDGMREDGLLTADQFDEFKGTLGELRDNLAAGKITADEFTQGMIDLKNATNEAVQAAKKKAAEERREALIKGDFEGAGLDPEEAIKEALAQKQLAKFNQGIDQLTDQMLGLNQSVDDNTDQLQGVSGDLKVNTSAINAGGGAGQQLQSLFNFLQSPQGEAATLINQINQLQSTINLLSSGFNPLGFSRLQNFFDEIERLQNRLRDISAAPPLITDFRFGDVLPEQLFAEGGTTDGRSSDVNLTFNAPSVHRDDVGRLVNMGDQIQRQRGSRVI